MIYYDADPARKTYRYQIWDQSRTLRALVRWYESEPKDRPRIGPLVERMIAGLARFATLRGIDPAWGPWLAWPSDEFANDRPGPPLSPDMETLREGLAIEPLVEYAELTKNARILDLATGYANCVMGRHAGDNVPPDQRRSLQIAQDGSFHGHFHCKTTSLIGIAKLGRCLALHGRLHEARRYLSRVRAATTGSSIRTIRAGGAASVGCPSGPAARSTKPAAWPTCWNWPKRWPPAPAGARVSRLGQSA